MQAGSKLLERTRKLYIIAQKSLDYASNWFYIEHMICPIRDCSWN